jgi:hypothetical protein
MLKRAAERPPFLPPIRREAPGREFCSARTDRISVSQRFSNANISGGRDAPPIIVSVMVITSANRSRL